MDIETELLGVRRKIDAMRAVAQLSAGDQRVVSILDDMHTCMVLLMNDTRRAARGAQDAIDGNRAAGMSR